MNTDSKTKMNACPDEKESPAFAIWLRPGYLHFDAIHSRIVTVTVLVYSAWMQRSILILPPL